MLLNIELSLVDMAFSSMLVSPCLGFDARRLIFKSSGASALASARLAGSRAC
jgi:hypothetical protein